MKDLGVKGAAFPSKFTPDSFVFVPLSVANEEQLDLNSSTSSHFRYVFMVSTCKISKVSFEN